MLKRFRSFLTQYATRNTKLSSVSVRVDDSAGWTSLTGRPHDYDPAKIQELYQDALEAWRKNPIAWRIIAITTDYVVGDQITITSPNRSLNKFIENFWHHPKNNVDLRLESMCDELSRAGDLFVLLFRNPSDGMSYIRFVTKDRIQRIETAENDWETELYYYETQDIGEPKRWPSADALKALSVESIQSEISKSPAIMLHYSINRPLGALMGESDLTTMIPWLLRYSRMLEDRVRLHWATRAFLWLVTVPANKVKEKQEFYRSPPEAGAIVVKDESEQWQAVTPLLRGSDASADLKAVRQMVDAGSGYPPHWRGEAADANLATATAMQAPTERHLLRRQQYVIYALQDILFHAYQRSAELGVNRPLRTEDYASLFTLQMSDVSRQDNSALALAASNISQSYFTLMTILAQQNSARISPTLAKKALEAMFHFSGQPSNEDEIEKIIAEIQANAPNLPPTQPATPSPTSPASPSTKPGKPTE